MVALSAQRWPARPRLRRWAVRRRALPVQPRSGLPGLAPV